MQGLEDARPAQGLLEAPNGGEVRPELAPTETDETTREELSQQEPLGLLVALVVQGLENQDLEHEQRWIGLASGGGGLVASQGLFDDGEKALPIHDAVQSSQWVNLLIEFFQEKLFIEQSGHHGRSPEMGG